MRMTSLENAVKRLELLKGKFMPSLFHEKGRLEEILQKSLNGKYVSTWLTQANYMLKFTTASLSAPSP